MTILFQNSDPGFGYK